MERERENEFDGRPELVKKRARSILIQRTLWAILGIYIVLSLAVLVSNALTGFQTRDTLVDCVDPQGQCYKDGQARTEDAIQRLIEANSLDEVATRRIVVLAAACAADVSNDTPDEIQACVDAQLKEDKKENR